MRINYKYVIGLILIITTITLNNSILYSKNLNNLVDPPPKPLEKGELYITISQNDLKILLSDKKSIEINLTAKGGDISIFDLILKLLKQPNKENKYFSWIEIEYNEKIYSINEEVKITGLKKDETKSLKINFNTDDRTILGEYNFEISSSYGNTKFSPSNLIKVLIFEKGNLIINIDKNVSSESPLIVRVDSTEELNFKFNFEKDKKIEGLTFKMEIVKLPFKLKKENIDWVYINETPYNIGEIKSIDITNELIIKFKPPKFPPIDFVGDYEFKIFFNLEIGNIIEPKYGEFDFFMKVVKYGDLKLEISKYHIELELGKEEKVDLFIYAESGLLKDLNIKFISEGDLNWINFEYEDNLYNINDTINIPILLEGEKKKIVINLNPGEDIKAGVYKIIIIGNNEEKKSIEINLLKPKLGELEVKFEESSKTIKFSDNYLIYCFNIKAIDGNVENIKFKLKPENSKFTFNYKFEPNEIEKLKKDEEVMINLNIDIPQDYKDLVEKNLNYLEEFNFEIEISYNDNKPQTKKISFNFDAIIIELKIGRNIIFVNNKSKEIDTPPQIIENRTYLPMRYIVEQLGGKVEWDNEEKKVTILFNEIKIELWIGKNLARVNNNYKLIDPDNPKVVPLIISGRTMLPVRFVAENLGCEIKWDPINKIVKIIYLIR